MSKQALSDADFLADLIRDPEVAAILNVNEKTVPVMRCRGQLPVDTYRVGRTTFTSRKSLVEYIKAGKLNNCA